MTHWFSISEIFLHQTTPIKTSKRKQTMNKTLWNRNKVTKKQLALITSLNLWRKRGSNVNNMVVGVLSGHFQSFKSGIWTSLRNATHLSQHHSHDPPDSWSLGFGQWVMGIPECTWMKDAMLHVLVTSCGTGRIGPLLSSTHGRTYRGISLSIKMQKKKCSVSNRLWNSCHLPEAIVTTPADSQRS